VRELAGQEVIMKIIVRFIATLAVLLFAGIWTLSLDLRGSFAGRRSDTDIGGASIVVGAQGHRITGRDYIFSSPKADAPLVVILHGDAPAIKPSYQYVFARVVAKSAPGTHVVGLLRPGYADPFGAKSDGDHGMFATADNYTPAVITDLTSAIEELKAKFAATTVIVVGHSGGAALAADVAAENRGLIQKAFLIGCPCDLPAFRRHMASAQHNPLWLLPVASISPMQTLDRMTASTTIRAITGSNDDIALPIYARTYVERAKGRGIPASLRILPKADHDILLDDVVIAEVVAAAK
jgi:predicted esterase